MLSGWFEIKLSSAGPDKSRDAWHEVISSPDSYRDDILHKISS